LERVNRAGDTLRSVAAAETDGEREKGQERAERKRGRERKDMELSNVHVDFLLDGVGVGYVDCSSGYGGSRTDKSVQERPRALQCACSDYSACSVWRTMCMPVWRTMCMPAYRRIRPHSLPLCLTVLFLTSSALHTRHLPETLFASVLPSRTTSLQAPIFNSLSTAYGPVEVNVRIVQQFVGDDGRAGCGCGGGGRYENEIVSEVPSNGHGSGNEGPRDHTQEGAEVQSNTGTSSHAAYTAVVYRQRHVHGRRQTRYARGKWRAVRPFEVGAPLWLGLSRQDKWRSRWQEAPIPCTSACACACARRFRRG